jgi:hypothetical protein
LHVSCLSPTDTTNKAKRDPEKVRASRKKYKYNMKTSPGQRGDVVSKEEKIRAVKMPGLPPTQSVWMDLPIPGEMGPRSWKETVVRALSHF